MKGKLLTVTQAAKLKGVSRTAIYTAIAQKRLRHTYSLERLVVREADILAWDAKRGRPVGKPMNEEHKARISVAQKQRWARRKQKKAQVP